MVLLLLSFWAMHAALVTGCFEMGQGIGGNEIYVGEADFHGSPRCDEMVRERHPSANGATYGFGECFAEFGMTGRGSSIYARSCLFTDPTPASGDTADDIMRVRRAFAEIGIQGAESQQCTNNGAQNRSSMAWDTAHIPMTDDPYGSVRVMCGGDAIIYLGVKFFEALTVIPDAFIAEVAALSQLYSLRITNTALTSIPNLSALTQITVLELFKNALTNISGLEALTQLEILYLNDNDLTSVPPGLELLTQLTQLRLDHNSITSLPDLSLLTSLTSLTLNHNALTSIPDLSPLTELKTLSLENNALTSVPGLATLTKIKHLRLYGNALTSLPDLSALTKLTYMHIYANRGLYCIPQLARGRGPFTVQGNGHHWLADQQAIDGGICVEGVVPNKDCIGYWTYEASQCGADCGRRYFFITAGQSGEGSHCEAAHGHFVQCQPGEGLCPPNIDCVGSWSYEASQCGADCGWRKFTIATEQSGKGSHCEAAHGHLVKCQPGEGSCPLNIDCVGSWSECNADCANRIFTITTAQSGEGSHCEFEHDYVEECLPGMGSCPIHVSGCVDLTYQGQSWYDRDGPYYNCAWYGSNGHYCRAYGHSYRRHYVANEACCVCGGGSK